MVRHLVKALALKLSGQSVDGYVERKAINLRQLDGVLKVMLKLKKK